MSGAIDGARLRDPQLRPIADKVTRGRAAHAGGRPRRSTPPPICSGLGCLADFANRRQNGDRVFFSANQHINPTNVCVLRNTCVFCSFARMPKEDGRLHPLAGGGVPRGGAGARRCRPASSTSWAGSIPSSG